MSKPPRAFSRQRILASLQTAGAFVAILVAWQLLVVGLRIPRYLVPTPIETVQELVARWSLLFQHSLITVREILLGFLLAVLVSVPCGLAAAFSRLFERTIMPVLTFAQLIPKIALAPLFIIWFGFGLFPKVLITFLLSFFPIVIDAVVGFKSLDQEIVYLTRSMGLTLWQAFFKVRLPHALPNIFAGLKVAITLATVGAIIGEFVGSDRGLGYLLLVATGDLRAALLFATLVVLTVIGLVLFYLMVVMERFAIPWHVSKREPLGTEGGL